MGIAVLGPLSIDGQETLGRRDRAVLAALAVHPGDEVRTERLYEVLWDDTPPASAAKVVQGCVVRLRKQLGPGAIETTAQGYRLAVPGDDVDASRFRQALARGSELLENGATDRASAVLAEALTWWRGDALPELEDWEPGRVEALRLGQLRLQAEELYVESELRRGAHDRVLAQALSMVDEAPLRERRWLLLARAHYQAGRQSDALDTIRRLREVLAEELGLDAGAEAGALEEAILRQDPSLTVAEGVVEPDAGCPYPGLLAYDVDDSATFFGRDADVSACLRRLRDASVVAVVGPSGSGKSSVVRAGVAAALLRDGRKVAVLTPGDHPMSSLAAVAGRARTVLLVDQGEEVFSLCRDLEERTAFLAALAAWVSTGQLVLSLRADHLVDLAAHPTFARTVERGLYLLGGMAEPDLREAIEGPARRSGLLVEPGLVDLLVNEVERQPGALPMLSHSLSETWKRREGRTLTLAAYQASGGIRGAVAMTAEAVYASGDDDHRAALRDVMLRLVMLDEDQVPLRTRLSRRGIVHDPVHDDVLDRLIAARLVTSDEGVVELAHEALARAWPRLRGWLEEDVDGQRIRQHLTVAAEAWHALGRPESELYRGVRLAAALTWRRTSDQPLPEVEADFLDASERQANAERLAAEEHARRQARANRSLRGLLGVVAVLLVAALVAGVLAVRQATSANHARLSAVRAGTVADRAATTADSRRLGARALTTDDISLSLLLAIEGVRLDDSEESRANLVAALARRPQLVLGGQEPHGHLGTLAGDGARGMLASSDGRNQVVFLSRRGAPFGYAPVGKQHASGHDLRLAFAPDGLVLAAAPEQPEADGRPTGVTLLDAFTREPLPHQPLPVDLGAAGATDVAFSGDGHRVAVAFRRPDSTSTALVWDLRQQAPPTRLQLPAGHQGIALDRAGRVLFASAPLTAYDVPSGRVRWRDRLTAEALDLDRDARLLAVPVDDPQGGSVVELARSSDGSVLKRLTRTTRPVSALAFAPDGASVAASDGTGAVTIWRTSSGFEQERLDAGPVSGLAWSHFGSYVLTTSPDGAARLWDLSGVIRYLARVAPPRLLADRRSAVFTSPDGRAAAFVWTGPDGAGHLRLWNADSGSAHQARLPTASSVRGGTWTADRAAFVAAVGDRLQRWDARTGHVVAAESLAATGPVTLTAAGGRLVGISGDGRLFQLDPASLAPVSSSVQIGANPCCLAAGPARGQVTVVRTGSESQVVVVDLDSARVVSRHRLPARVLSLAASATADVVVLGTAEGRVVVLDPRSGATRSEPGSGHEPPVTWVGASPNGRAVVTTSDDGSVRLWDVQRAHLRLTLHTPERAGLTADFVSNDEDLLLASPDGAIYRWDTSPGRIESFACAAAGRPMTRAEWTAYVGDRPYERLCRFSTSFTNDPTQIDVGDVVSPGPPNEF